MAPFQDRNSSKPCPLKAPTSQHKLFTHSPNSFIPARPPKKDQEYTLPLPATPSQLAILRTIRNLAPLGQEENIPFASLDALARLIADLKVVVHDDLHLIVYVGVDQFRTRREAVEARVDGDDVGKGLAAEEG